MEMYYYFIQGNLCNWDFNSYNITNIIESPDISATAVTIGDDNSIFVGYSNGYVKNYLFPTFDKLWEKSTHRGNVNTIFVNSNYILSGGEDGVLRIWTRKTHELSMQFSAHHKDVYKIFSHCQYPNLVYTCGADKNLNLFDLKNQKRINNQEVNNGFMTYIDQRKEPDYEVGKYYITQSPVV